MPVTDIRHDLDSCSLTVTAEFAAPVERVWQLYADPRQLEKIWGPRGFPATVVGHDLTPGGRVTYYMTGPDGDKYPGYWDVVEVAEPHSLRIRDGFARDDLSPNPDLPVSGSVYSFEAADGGTRATYVTRYATREDLQQVLDMGVEDGTRSAMGQIDELLAG